MLKGKDVEYVWIWLLTGEYWIAVSTGISIFPSFFLNMGSLNFMFSVFLIYFHLDLRYTFWIVPCILILGPRFTWVSTIVDEMCRKNLIVSICGLKLLLDLVWF